MQVVKATFAWLYHFTVKQRSHQESILHKFEQNYPKSEIDESLDPINILLLDGGGMKGYALNEMMSVIDEKYGEDQTGILSYFDLIGGASIVGALAMILNKMKSVKESCDENRDGTDDIRERVFSRMKLSNLLISGASIDNNEDQMAAIFSGRWGSPGPPLLYPDGPPAMAVAAMRYDDCVEPIVLRTYNYPNTGSKNFNQHDAIVKSSSSIVSGTEATAATAAVPGVVHQIKATMGGKEVSLADGGLFGNCPIAIAIDEARRLYPRRPLGVVLSIGLNKNDEVDSYIKRSVKIAKSVNPALHFHRIVPDQILTDISPLETNIEKIAMMEEEVRRYMRHDQEISSTLDTTMEILQRQSRNRPRYSIEKNSAACIRREAMLSEENYLKRMQSRLDIVSEFHDKKTQDENSGNGAPYCGLWYPGQYESDD
jgi:predicted acylesterase/phospholipase RssA